MRWENVQAFGFAESGSALVLKKRKTDTDAEHDGTDLLVRYLPSGEEELFSYVDEWAFDEKGTRLAYTLDTPDGESNGVHLLDLTTRARRVLDAERKVNYARLTWGDEKDEPSADALAVLKGGEDEKLVEIVNALLLWPALSKSVKPVVLDPRPAKADTTGGEGAPDRGGADARVPDAFPEGWVLSEKGELSWAEDASRIFVATRPQLPAPKTLCKPAVENAGRRGARGDSASRLRRFGQRRRRGWPGCSARRQQRGQAPQDLHHGLALRAGRATPRPRGGPGRCVSRLHGRRGHLAYR